jgi:hypothetical protein
MSAIEIYERLCKMIEEGLDFFAEIPEPGSSREDMPTGSHVPYDKYTKYVETASARRVENCSVIDEIALKMFPNEKSQDFRRAVALVYQFYFMGQLVNLRANVFADSGSKVVAEPIHIWDKADPTKTREFTITQFLSFQPNKLSVRATLDDLINSAETRETRDV